TVALVAMDGLQLLDLAGPVEVLHGANYFAGTDLYRTIVATPGGRDVRSASGVRLGADVALEELARSGVDVDTLTVVGGFGAPAVADDDRFVADVADLGSRAGRTTSVCTGALVLARAGLLDDHAATTHWAFADQLAAFDRVDVRSEQIYVRDRDRWTAAGVTAGIDLFLALVDEDHGPQLAHMVAAMLVVFVRRPGGQAQFSAQLGTQPATTPSIAEVQRWLSDHLDDDLSVDALASRAAMSPRNFARCFRAETGTTPAAYVEQVRIEAARRLLETTDLRVAAIARRVGIRHAETLHRAFRRRVGTTPERYRQHFGRQAS
ncbi:MAG: GlxA family transcriptional regulator, partial [Acidimicrobiales bacterium]|nr:GlxA family transcriptional regulator [Acidimicrobiales bacterium]